MTKKKSMLLPTMTIKTVPHPNPESAIDVTSRLILKRIRLLEEESIWKA